MKLSTVIMMSILCKQSTVIMMSILCEAVEKKIVNIFTTDG